MSDCFSLERLKYLQQVGADLAQLDFGLIIAKQTENEIWFRGYGEEPYVYHAQKGPSKFLGGAFLVESAADLEKYGSGQCYLSRLIDIQLELYRFLM